MLGNASHRHIILELLRTILHTHGLHAELVIVFQTPRNIPSLPLLHGGSAIPIDFILA